MSLRSTHRAEDVIDLGIDLDQDAATGPSGAIFQGVLRGGLWSVGGQVATAVASIVATPFTIRLLGPERYGLLALVNVIIVYLVVGDLGMGGASTKLGAAAFAHSDSERECAVVWTSLALCVLPAIVVGALVLFGAPQLATLLNAPRALRGDAILATRLVGVIFVARVVAGVLNTPQVIRLRWGIVTSINSGTSVLQIVLIPAVIAVGGGVASAVMAMAGIALITTVAQGAAALRVQPALWHPRVRRELVRPLGAFGGMLVASSFVSLPLANIERLLLAHFQSVRAVAYYSVAANLAALLAILPLAVGAPLFPALSRLHAVGDMRGFTRIRVTVVRGMWLTLTPLALALFATSGPIIRIWAGSAYVAHSTTAFDILLVGLAANGVGYASQIALYSMNRVGMILQIEAVELVVYLGAGGLLTWRYGVIGAAIAWAARTIIHAFVITVFAGRASGSRLGPLVNRGWLYLGAIGVLAVPMVWFSLSPPMIVVRALAILAALVAHLAIVWKFELTGQERIQVGAAVRRRALPTSHMSSDLR